MSFILAKLGMYLLSGMVLICAAVFLYWKEYRRTGVLLNLRGLLALGLIGGEGVSCLKLSRLQTDWTVQTWLSFYLFYLVFFMVYGAVELYLEHMPCRKRKNLQRAEKKQAQTESLDSVDLRFYRHAIRILIAVSWAAFLFEAWVLGYVPLLVKDTPHAYSYFHISGVHYFTTIAVLIPALGVCYRAALLRQRSCDVSADKRSKTHGGFLRALCARAGVDAVFLASVILPLVLTVLLVSRFQFLFAVLLAVFAYLLSGKRFRLWQLAALGAGMVFVYVLITIARAHSVEYLNGIFEMRNPNMPIFITQPYMYIANNYDNFNCLTEQLPAHTHGLRMLFPLFALTGLKFLKPSLVSFPLYTTKAELTTLTLIYDAYYDFGLIGVVLFALVLAVFCAWLANRQAYSEEAVLSLFYVQLAFYLLFSFFTTWFSNPATWFYFVITAMLLVAQAIWRRRHA